MTSKTYARHFSKWVRQRTVVSKEGIVYIDNLPAIKATKSAMLDEDTSIKGRPREDGPNSVTKVRVSTLAVDVNETHGVLPIDRVALGKKI